MTDYAKRPWPQNVWPTPEQWRAWFLACSPEAQAVLADLVVEDAQRSYRCLLEHHPFSGPDTPSPVSGPVAASTSGSTTSTPTENREIA